MLWLTSTLQTLCIQVLNAEDLWREGELNFPVDMGSMYVYKGETMRTLKVMIGGGKVFDEGIITVEIVDEGGGEFVEVREQADTDRVIGIDPTEWQALRDAIDLMIGACQ